MFLFFPRSGGDFFIQKRNINLDFLKYIIYNINRSGTLSSVSAKGGSALG